jgi:hypothetical protein
VMEDKIVFRVMTHDELQHSVSVIP